MNAPIVITEGPIECDAIEMTGYEAIVWADDPSAVADRGPVIIAPAKPGLDPWTNRVAKALNGTDIRVIDLGYWVSLLDPDNGQRLALIEQAPPYSEWQRKATQGEPRPEENIGTRRLVLTPASTITIRPTKWLWADRVPVGTFGLLGGREGVGKSQTWVWLAAGITRGTLPGEYMSTPMSVIVVATEDSWSHVLVPRLVAAGADLDRVFRVDALAADRFDSTLMLPQDNDDLKVAIITHDVALVVLDPLLSRLDPNLDTHKDSEVRRALEPLSRIADETRCTFMGLIHVNKGNDDDPLSTLMASRAFPAVARFVLYMAVDPDDEDKRLLGLPKNQYGRTDQPTLVGHIEGVHVADTDEGSVFSARIVYDGETSLSIRDAVTEAHEVHGATSDAAAWMADYLAAGSAERKTVMLDGRKAGHSDSALKRASKRLKVISRLEGFPASAHWELPATSRTSPVGSGRGESEPTELAGPTGSVGPVGSGRSAPPRSEPTQRL